MFDGVQNTPLSLLFPKYVCFTEPLLFANFRVALHTKTKSLKTIMTEKEHNTCVPSLLMVYFTKKTWFCQNVRMNSEIDGFARPRLENIGKLIGRDFHNRILPCQLISS